MLVFLIKLKGYKINAMTLNAPGLDASLQLSTARAASCRLGNSTTIDETPCAVDVIIRTLSINQSSRTLDENAQARTQIQPTNVQPNAKFRMTIGATFLCSRHDAMMPGKKYSAKHTIKSKTSIFYPF